MAQLGEGEKVVCNTTESGSGVRLFNSIGALAPLQLETPRVHPSNAGISRVEDSCLQFFYRWVSAYSRWVNPHSDGRIRLFAKRGSVPSGGLGEGVLSIGDKETQSRYTQQPARKPSATGGSARSVEVGGSGGFSGGRALAADAGGRGRSSSGGRGAESVPSAGWREVAEAYHATEGQSHE